MSEASNLEAFVRDTANKQVLIYTMLLKHDVHLAEFFLYALQEFVEHPNLPEHTREAASDLLRIAETCLKIPPSTPEEPEKRPRPDWLQFVVEGGKQS